MPLDALRERSPLIARRRLACRGAVTSWPDASRSCRSASGCVRQEAPRGRCRQGRRLMTQSKSRQPVAPGATGAYPVLPLRDIVVFPHMIVPLFVGREKSITALEEVMRADKQILLVAQKNAARRRSRRRRHLQVGTLATVLQLLKLPDGTVKVLVEGTRARRDHALHRERRAISRPRSSASPRRVGDRGRDRGARRARSCPQFESYVKLNKKISPEVLGTVSQIEDYSQARRHHRLAPRASRSPRSRRCSRSPTVAERLEQRLRADGERDLRPAGREAHPRPRQAPDGEDASASTT